MYNALVMPYFTDCNYCSTVFLYGAISARGYQTKFKNCETGLPEFSAFQITKLAQSTLLDELGWQSFENKRLKQLATIMYKIYNNLSPSYLRRIFSKTSNVHAHNLRNCEINNCYFPNPRTEYGKGSIHYRGSVLWNKISSEIRNLSSLKLFKTSLNGKDTFSAL